LREIPAAARPPTLIQMAQAPTSHVPPQNIEAEESVLGAMLVAEPALTRVIDEVKLNGEDFYLDLLFYHRKLRRLVAVDLKLGKLRAGDKGQMELYLRWLEKHEAEPGEESPLGLILCADKGDEQVELLQLHQSGIRVASYLTELPARSLLEKKLHEAVRAAEARLANRTAGPSAGR